MSSRILIRGGCVLTLGAKTPNHLEADVMVEGDKVVEVGRELRSRDAAVIDATDTIVMPGFVDTHRHAWRSLFRNLGEGGPGENDPAVYGSHIEPEDVYAAILIGLLGAVEAGITTVVDCCDVLFDDAFTEAALQAHADAGLRTVFVHSPPRWAEDHRRDGSDLRTFVAQHGHQIGPTTIASGTSDPSEGLDEVAAEWARARDLGLRSHTHAGSTRADRGAVAALGERGLLGPDVTLVHCTSLDGGDLDAVAAAGAAVSLTPSSEMAGGLGSPPMQQLIDRGIRPGLGIGDERVAPGDMFAPMRGAISLQHATYFDLKLAGKAGLPHLLTTRQVIRYATSDGATAIGLGDLTGSLEPGKQADIVVLRADRPNIAPVNDPIGAVVWGMDTSNVDWVFAAGRALMRNGTLEGDVERARRLAVAAQRRVATAAGLAVGSAAGGER